MSEEVLDQERIIDPADVPMRPTAMRYGGMVALALIVIILIFTLTGFSDPEDATKTGNKIQQFIGYAGILVAIVLAIKHHRDNELGGYIKYDRGLGMGTLVGLVMGVITAIWTLINMYVIDPELQDKIKYRIIKEAIANGATEEAMQQRAGMIDFISSPAFLSIASLIGAVLVAFIMSLVVAAIMKKDPPGNV
ncbi:MAG: hypothetical protein Kow0027_17230 [Saprospiraceae bacterium]